MWLRNHTMFRLRGRTSRSTLHEVFTPYNAADYPGDDGNGPKPLVFQDTTLMDGRATMGGFNALVVRVDRQKVHQ